METIILPNPRKKTEIVTDMILKSKEVKGKVRHQTAKLIAFLAGLELQDNLLENQSSTVILTAL